MTENHWGEILYYHGLFKNVDLHKNYKFPLSEIELEKVRVLEVSILILNRLTLTRFYLDYRVTNF